MLLVQHPGRNQTADADDATVADAEFDLYFDGQQTHQEERHTERRHPEYDANEFFLQLERLTREHTDAHPDRRCGRSQASNQGQRAQQRDVAR